MSDRKDSDDAPGFSEAEPGINDDHAYEMWARRKIERALKRSIENPDDHVPQEEVWRLFKLEH